MRVRRKASPLENPTQISPSICKIADSFICVYLCLSVDAILVVSEVNATPYIYAFIKIIARYYLR